MRAVLIALTAAAMLTMGGAAVASDTSREARPSLAFGQGLFELFPGEGVAEGRRKHLQHGGPGGHLAPRKDNVAVIGKSKMSAPPGTNGDLTGRVADVSASGNYAYLTAFRADDCLGGGAWIVDMKNPKAPAELAFLPTTQGVYAGEGSQTITPEHGPYKGRTLFIHQNETCSAALAAATGKPRYRGGINIWDVTNPSSPKLLVEHAGDVTGPVAPNPNDSHSMFAWNSHVDKKVYAVLIDNFEFADLDILDITDPTNPVMVNDTLDLFDLFGIGADNPPHLQAIFSHDMMVYRKGARYVMNVNYWDGGYVLLDVTDPRPGKVTLIANWEYPELDDERLKRGHEMLPEGNAHQSEFSPDFNYLIGTDEDFSPSQLVGMIMSGPFMGAEFSLANASDTPSPGHHDPGDPSPPPSIDGPTTFVGLACTATGGAPAGSGTALIERGACPFQEKLNNVVAAGYDAGIVFNSAIPGCNGLVTMLAGGDIPFVFVARETGLKILGINAPGDAACTTASPAPGSPSADVMVEAEFNGWGYVRLFRTKFPASVGSTGSMEQIDTYAIAESQDPAFAVGFGDLTVHEVATDPRPGTNLAYFSYYAGGFRVAEYGKKGLKEVGAFIDQGGNNFWGVEVHKHPNGKYYVLASDRDYGLYIFQYTGKIPGGDRGNSKHDPRP
jgi:hypothetical protein